MKDIQFNKIAIIAAVALCVLLSAYLVLSSGVFDKAPEVEAAADNCYDKTLVVITDEDYSPYSFYAEDGSFSGHDVELITEIANQLRMNLDLRFMSWYDGIEELSKGNADVLMTCDYSDSFEGVDVLLKTEPVSFDDFLVYSKKKIVSADEMYGKKIAIMKNGNVKSQIDMLELSKFCIEYPDNRQAMQALIDGKVDFAVMRQTVGTVLKDELNANSIEGYLSLGRSYMCFGIGNSNEELVEEINGAIEVLKMSGEMERLRTKWLTTFVQPYSVGEVLQNNIWIVIVFSLLIALTAFTWVRDKSRVAANAQEKARNAQVVEHLSQDFECVNYVILGGNVEEDTVVNYRVSEKLKELIPGWEKEKLFFRKMNLLRDNVVYEPDRKQFEEDVSRNNVLRELNRNSVYFVNIRTFFDDEIKYYQMKFSAVRKNGKLEGVVAGLHSVDEQTKKEIELQDNLEAALLNAESANRAKTTFLNSMSHDIRTPMNAITGFTGMAKKHIDEREKVSDYLDKIDASGRQLLTLINQVLEMARIESGRSDIEEKPVNVRDVFSALVTVLSEQAQVNGLEFRHSMENISHGCVYSDEAKMNSITLNIVGNALKYTPKGGSIDFVLKEIPPRKEGYATLVLTVADTGIGMSKEYLKVLFEPFSREKSSTVSRIQGTGLGMSIVKELVDMMGGQIDVQSEPGKGTRFDVTIDFRICDEEQLDTAEEQEKAYVSLEGRRVLLVDDNELNREIAIEVLTDEGIAAEDADDGSKAVELLRQKGPDYYDLILMDIQMPVMGGYEATKIIREMYPERHIPIIALSANAFEEDKAFSLAAGMDAHVAKPINIQELCSVMSKLL